VVLAVVDAILVAVDVVPAGVAGVLEAADVVATEVFLSAGVRAQQQQCCWWCPCWRPCWRHHRPVVVNLVVLVGVVIEAEATTAGGKLEGGSCNNEPRLVNS